MDTCNISITAQMKSKIDRNHQSEWQGQNQAAQALEKEADFFWRAPREIR
jgi:hypothetical protein